MAFTRSPSFYSASFLCLMLVANVGLINYSSLARPKSHLNIAKYHSSLRVSADLKIFVSAAVDGFVPGLYYPLGVQNKGSEIARNVSVSFPVPSGAAFNKIYVNPRLDQVRCNTPPFNGTGDVVCSLGDLAPNEGILLDFYFDIIAPPGTKISAEARVESDTPDPTPTDNIFKSESTAPPLSRLDSARILDEPFRIEIVGQNLFIPQFVGSGIGIGCDCRGWSMVRAQSPTVFVIEGGKELKKLFPKGVPTRICYSDGLRGRYLTLEVTR